MWQIVTRKATPSGLVRDAFGGLTLVLSVDDGSEWYFPLDQGEIEQYGLAQAVERVIERHNAAQERTIEPIPEELLKEYEVKFGNQIEVEDIVNGNITYESYLEEAIMLMEAVIDHENTIEQLKAEIASLKQALGRA